MEIVVAIMAVVGTLLTAALVFSFFGFLIVRSLLREVLRELGSTATKAVRSFRLF